MKKLLVLSLVSLIIATTGCKKVEDDPVGGTSAYKTMTTYMVDNGMDLDDILDDWITGPPTATSKVDSFANYYFIIDLRNQTDYDNGHIKGAVNSTLADILNKAAGATKPILVVCYTGQTAGHGVVALRLSGYPDAKVLKWGMCGWRADLSSKWNDATGDAAIGNPNWLMTPALATPTTFSDPTLSVSGDGATMLATRVTEMLNGGFNGIEATDVLGTPANYFINNYWDMTAVDDYGHIDGAFRINPLTIENGQMSNMDPNEVLVTYCWTGQTSSMITAYLKVLGFNAKSLMYGSNTMIYSNLQGHKFSTPTVDLPVVN
jgi:rhodanese-related sulfurtransferase